MEPFRVHILGCGSALPTLRHNASSQVVEVRDKVLMLDCAEGTQMQLRRCRVRFTKLSHVFITHLHGDHCFGLIGMISTFGLLGRTARLHVHAPQALGPELERQIQQLKQLSQSKDTVRDSIPVPYPVPARLTSWQQQTMFSNSPTRIAMTLQLLFTEPMKLIQRFHIMKRRTQNGILIPSALAHITA